MPKIHKRRTSAAPNPLLHHQEEERRSIARQFHDTVGQNMAALQMNLSLMADSAAAMDLRSRQALLQSLDLAQVCVREIRNVSYALYPPLLEELGLATALRAYIGDYTQRTGIDLSLDLPARLGRFERIVEITMFRIVQEGLASMHRKSRGPTQLRIRKRIASVLLELIDPGSLEERDDGILRLEARAGQLRGKVVLEQGSAGSILRAILPFGKQRAKAARQS